MSHPGPLVEMRQLEGACVAGRYRLVRYLSEGAFGAVYQGVHMAYGLPLRPVAVKVAKRPMNDHEARTVFRDALTVARVVHEIRDPVLRQRFVEIHDAGRCEGDGPLEGRPFLVMEYVAGGSLGHCLRDGPFPLTRAVAYFDQMLDAVACMHGGLRGADGTGVATVVHRDIKPDNFLIVRRADAPDLVKITDFGLAQEVDNLTSWVSSSGDLAYLPLETFTENMCSPQSDVYMLALVFYEMVTGVSPFATVARGANGAADVRERHAEARRRESFRLLGEQAELRVRPALADVIRAALATERHDRPYRDAQELRAAWEAAKRGVGGPPGREQVWERAARLVREARCAFGQLDDVLGQARLDEALALSRHEVPTHLIPGDVYLLAVERCLARGRSDEAREVASEGHGRRVCRATCEALARALADANPAVAARFTEEARKCRE